MYKLIVMVNGDVQSKAYFKTFDDVKQHLITTDYFSWINDNEPEKELPNFENVEDVDDLESIFVEYDYSWWTMSLEDVEDQSNIVDEVRKELESGSYYIEYYNSFNELLDERDMTLMEYNDKISEVEHEIIKDVPLIVYEDPGSSLFNVAYITKNETAESIIDRLK